MHLTSHCDRSIEYRYERNVMGVSFFFFFYLVFLLPLYIFFYTLYTLFQQYLQAQG